MNLVLSTKLRVMTASWTILGRLEEERVFEQWNIDTISVLTTPTSAPAMHVFGTDHEMSVDELEILGVERKVREAIEIMRHDTMNLKEQSLQLTPMWRSLLDLRKRRRSKRSLESIIQR